MTWNINNSIVQSTSYLVGNILTASTVYGYDDLNRVSSKTYAIDFDDSSHAFAKVFSYDKTRIDCITHSNLGSDSYEYDAYGRITEYTHDSAITKYTYDSFGQLIREDNPTLDKTLIYCYDKIRNTRYYDPVLRRFLSLDSTEYLAPETPNGLNLYAYCYNALVNYADPSGHLAILISVN